MSLVPESFNPVDLGLNIIPYPVGIPKHKTHFLVTVYHTDVF